LQSVHVSSQNGQIPLEVSRSSSDSTASPPHHDPSAALDFFGQTTSATFKVAVFVKEFPASIAPGDDMINGTGVLKSRQTWHRAIDPTGSTGKRNAVYQSLSPDAIPNPESDPSHSRFEK
jgi:hypothetical protein